MVYAITRYERNVHLTFYSCGHGEKHLSRGYSTTGCIAGQVRGGQAKKTLPATMTVVEARIAACEWIASRCDDEPSDSNLSPRQIRHFMEQLRELPLGLCEKCLKKNRKK